MAHQTRNIATAVRAAELLELNLKALQKHPEAQSDSWSREEKPSVKNLDLTQVLEGHRERLRCVPSKFDKVWDGNLEEINITFHRFILKLEAQHVTQHPNRTGPNTGEFVAEEVDRIGEANISELATAEWASPVVVVPKHDGLYNICIQYHKFNAVTIRNTYLHPRTNECLIP